MSIAHKLAAVEKTQECLTKSLQNIGDLVNTYSELVHDDKISVDELRKIWLILSKEMKAACMLTGAIGDALSKITVDVLNKYNKVPS